MSSVIPFDFHGSEVRTLVGEDGGIWFVASDVAVALGYRDALNMVRNLDEDEADTHNVSIRSENEVEQTRSVTIINESGIYNAIFGSRKPSAKKFRKWVTSEVLPSIRRTGTYTRGENAPIDPTMAALNAMEELDRAMRVVDFTKSQKVNLLHLSMESQGLGIHRIPEGYVELAIDEKVASFRRINIRDDIFQAVDEDGPLQFHEVMDICEIEGGTDKFDHYCEEIESMVEDGTLKVKSEMRPIPGTDGWVTVYAVE